MAYNTVAIKKDLDGKPVPQVYNTSTKQYEPLEGSCGSSKVVLYSGDGTEINLVELLKDITSAIDILVEVVRNGT